MESFCLRQTEIPGASKLYTDLLYRYDRVAEFYPHPPGSQDGCREVATKVAFPASRRAALVSALRRWNLGSPSLDLLAREGTVAVLTGQQVGLFSGPSYTVYKALTAIRLAAELTASGTNAVPIFWLATEDHDFPEVNQAWSFDARLKPHSFRATDPMLANRPVGGLPMIDAPLAELEASLADLPYGQAIAAQIREHYSNGTFGSAFLGICKEWLGKLGLLFVDPLDPEIRQIFAPKLAEAVLRTDELSSALLERNLALTAQGYHAQVHFEPETSLVFLLENGVRVGLKRKKGQYFPEKLAERAESLSPNALLRPVLQDYLFPTVAVVGGPAELAYFAQSEVLYQKLLGYMPVSVARAGFTLIPARGQKLLERYHLSVKDVWQGCESVRERIARQLIPAELAATMAQSQAETEAQIRALNKQLCRFDPTLGAALANSSKKIEYQFAKIAQKVNREVLRRDERASADAAYLVDLLFPEKHLQERLYSIVPFLAMYGEDLIDRLYEHVKLECPDHQVLAL